MRKLESFEDRELAHTVRDVLLAEGIECETRTTHDGQEALWVLDAEQLEDAQRILDDVRDNPQGARVVTARAELAERQAAANAAATRAQAARRAVSTRPAEKPAQEAASVSLGLILACGATALFTDFGDNRELVASLRIAGFEREPFRLITPIFLHFGVLHLVFNMFWLLDLGVALEKQIGSARYALLVATSAALSNLAQLYFGHSPNFGGMSGVIYALVGYLWMRGRVDPQGPVRPPPRVVSFFVVWMALGFTPAVEALFGAMANYCHVGGFLSGSLAGYLAAHRHKRRLHR